MDPLAGLLSVGGGIINNLFAGSRQKDAQNFAAGQVQQQEQFQEHMRATAYQTAVTDMKAAGLNPMMMAGINTSVPSGGAATGIAPAPVHDVIGPALSSAVQSSKLTNELALGAQELKNKMATGDLIDSQKWNVQANTAATMAEIKGKVGTSEIITSHMERAKNEAIEAQKERPYLDSALKDYLAPTAKAASDIYKLIPPIKIQGSSAKSNQGGWIGGNEVNTNQNRSVFDWRFGN